MQTLSTTLPEWLIRDLEAAQELSTGATGGIRASVYFQDRGARGVVVRMRKGPPPAVPEIAEPCPKCGAVVTYPDQGRQVFCPTCVSLWSRFNFDRLMRVVGSQRPTEERRALRSARGR